MNNKVLTAITILALSVTAISLTLTISHTGTTQAADAPQGNNVYVFGEGVYPQATFEFRDGTVTYDFQLFSQTSGFGNNRSTPEFTLTKISGNTPDLYEAVDQTHDYTTKTNIDFPYKEFDVTVNLMQAGQPVRTLEYERCTISNYKIDTRTDNEEGYTTGGKTGFAVTDIYTFICAGYSPENPQYDQMLAEKQKPYE